MPITNANDNDDSSPHPNSSQTEEYPSISQTNPTQLPYPLLSAQSPKFSYIMGLNTIEQSYTLAQEYAEEEEESIVQDSMPTSTHYSNTETTATGFPSQHLNTTNVQYRISPDHFKYHAEVRNQKTYIPIQPQISVNKPKQKNNYSPASNSRKQQSTPKKWKTKNQNYESDTEYFSLESSDDEDEQSAMKIPTSQKAKHQIVREEDRNDIVMQLIHRLMQLMTDERSNTAQAQETANILPKVDLNKLVDIKTSTFNYPKTETSSVKLKVTANQSETSQRWIITATPSNNVNNQEVSSWQPGTEKITFSPEDDVLSTELQQRSEEAELKNLQSVIDEMESAANCMEPNSPSEAEKPLATCNDLEALPIEQKLNADAEKPFVAEDCCEAEKTLSTAEKDLAAEKCVEPLTNNEQANAVNKIENNKCAARSNEDFKECLDPDECNVCPDTVKEDLTCGDVNVSKEVPTSYGQGDEQDCSCDKVVPVSKASSLCGKGDDLKCEDDDDSKSFSGNVVLSEPNEKYTPKKNKQKNGKCNCCHCRAMSKKTSSDCASKIIKDKKERKSMELVSCSSQYSGSIYKAKPYMPTVSIRPPTCIPPSFPVTIISATPLGNSSLYVKWTIHDCYNIGGYELYVDNYMTNRYFNGNHTAAVVCNVDVKRSLKIVLMAHRKIEEVAEESNCMALQNLHAANTRKWVPSVYLYDPHRCV